MATTAIANGDIPTSMGNGSTLAEHSAEHVHRPTVEDVPDEDELQHPGSAGQPDTSASNPSEPLPEKVGDKDPVQAEAESEAQAKKPSAPVVPDTHDKIAFPALGSGPRPRNVAPVTWGAKKQTTGKNGLNELVVGHGSAASSGTTSQSNGFPHVMSLPGKYVERIQFAPSQLLQRHQLKKTPDEVLRDINKKSRAKVEIHSGPNQSVVFVGKGPVDAVRQALKEVAQQLGSKQSVKVPIPASVRPHIIGKQGSVVQGIIQRTGARIKVPKPNEQQTSADDDDDDNTIDVLIEGDAVAAEMARREIEEIVNQRTSTVNTRMKDVPPEFFPFIAGPHNANVLALEQGKDLKIKVPHYQVWTHNPPPQQPDLPDQFPAFVGHPSDYIQLSGDRNSVQEVREEIEHIVQRLRREITLQQLPINRGQHQFIIGDRGDSLSSFLEETGCAVILPPPTADTEMLTIVGPAERLEDGMNKVMDLATSMQMASVDLSRQHVDAPQGPQAYARDLTRYFQERQAIEKLEHLYNSHIVLPTSETAPMIWEVYSRDGKNTIKARSDIMNIINAHPPARMTRLGVDPFYYHYLQERSLNHIQDDYGVRVIFPDEHAEKPQILLVYEGPLGATGTYLLPRQKPTSPELAQFRTALSKAQDDILNFVKQRPEITEKTVEVPSKFYHKLERLLTKEQQQFEIPVRVQYGPSRSPHHPLPDNVVLLRGPTGDITELASKIEKFVEQEKIEELERDFTLEFDFPQKFASHLIGRKGEHINKFRDEFDVEIQLHEGKVEIKGPQRKAEAAKAHIIALVKRLEDEVTHVLKIKPQYHRDLIGAKGSQVNRLQERYNVRVQFPRSTHNNDDDQSVADSDGARTHRSNQAPDEVIVKGPRKGADEARDEILNLLQWTIDHSYSALVSVAQTQIPSLIGQGGREMENLRLVTGAQIDVPNGKEATDTAGRVEIRIKGTKKQVEDAKKLLEERAKTFDESVTKTIDVDKKHHRALIGVGGSNIRNIVLQAGGSDDRRELARTVRFPRPDSQETSIRIEGKQNVVDKIVAAIEAFVSERENRVTETLEIPPEKHGLLIGRGGDTRRGIESKFHVNLDIPRQSTQGPSRSHVKLEGTPENVAKAKEHILVIIESQAGETILVPRSLHHLVADNGQFFRRLRSDLKVTVDHAGQHPPERPQTPDIRAKMSEGAMPLITDEQTTPDEKYGWEMVNVALNNDTDETIPWVLSGTKENVAAAKALVEKAIERAKQETATGYLILPDPRTYRFVIGPGGSHVKAIRNQTGCKIQVPRNQTESEAIEIRGTPEGVEKAKQMVLDAVKKGRAGSPRG